MQIPISITTDQTIKTQALVNSGAGGTFIDGAYAAAQNILVSLLLNPIPVFHVDGTPNQQGLLPIVCAPIWLLLEYLLAHDS